MRAFCSVLISVVVFSSLGGPALAADPITPIVGESTASSELVAKALITPTSPVYFLKTLWENIHWLIKRTPEVRALWALDLAEARLSEILTVSEEENFSLVERLFKERQELLARAGEELARLTVEEGRQEIGERFREQLALGNEVLARVERVASGEEALRLENLAAWRGSWVAELEAGLGPHTDAPEATAAASGSGGSNLLESITDFLFNPKRPLLSPLAAPQEN